MHQSISNNAKLELSSTQTDVSKDIPADSTRAGYSQGDTSTNWWQSLKQVTPIYIAMHITLLVLTYLATLFSLRNFSSNALPLSILLDSWDRWDSGQFTSIATKGYDAL